MRTQNNIYPHNARADILALVPADAQRLLDVGCNTGAFGEALKASRPVEVWGVEPNVEAAGRARSILDVVVADAFVESAPIPDDYFDVVTFNDSIEHMADPWAALELAGRKLRAGGRVIAAIPNFRHIDNLLHIMRDGDFRYEDTGIRDRTHLRFFTRSSGIRLFEESGYDVVSIHDLYKVWWTPSIVRRLAYRIFARRMEDTKYVRFAFVATKRTDPRALRLPARDGMDADGPR